MGSLSFPQKKRYKSFMVFATKIYCMQKFSHVVVKCRIITHTYSFGFPKICEKRDTLTHSLVFLTLLHTTRLDSTRLDSTPHDSTRLDSTRLHTTRLDSTRLHTTPHDSTQLDSTRLDSTPLNYLKYSSRY